MLLKEIPNFERPREKVLEGGIEQLSNVELLAILLRTGTSKKNVLRLSEEILYKLSSIEDFKEITIPELTKIEGIGNAKAITILAAVELGKRLSQNNTKEEIRSGNKVFDLMKNDLSSLKEERLFGLYLNTKGILIAKKELTKGSVSSTIIDPEIIFKWYYKLSASAIILVHNHPSGDPTPSIPDLKMTDEVVKKAKYLKITILDHIVIGNTFYSMRENNTFYKIF